MRNALADTLYELAKEDERLCVLVADISPAGSMEKFRAEFPTRFINTGVAEQSMIGIAAGMAMRGLRPFCYTIATFALFRPYEFVRCDLSYQRLPVTVVGMGAGLNYSTLGGTHQAVEDVAVAMACPGMTVIAPCDPIETAEVVRWCAARSEGGPVYLRLGKVGEPDITSGLGPWKFGRLQWGAKTGEAPDCVLSYGPIAVEARNVAAALGADWALVSTLRPLDEDGLLAMTYKRVIVIEEAAGTPLAREVCMIRGSSVAHSVVSFALPREFVHGLGSRQDLLDNCGLTAEKILARL